MKKHNEYDCIKQLDRKRDCKIASSGVIVILQNHIFIPKEGKTIRNPNKHFDLGNKSWGKIDYLINHCGYSMMRVDRF